MNIVETEKTSSKRNNKQAGQRVNDLVEKLSKKDNFKIEKDKKNGRKRFEMKLVEIGIKRFPSFFSIFQSMQKDFSHISYFFCFLLYLCLIFISYHL